MFTASVGRELEIFKPLILVSVWIAAAGVEPLALPWVLGLSLLLGFLGGVFSAKKNGHETLEDKINHAGTMSLIGAGITMVGYWYFANDERVGLLLIGITSIGAAISDAWIDPSKELIKRSIEAVKSINPSVILSVIQNVIDRFSSDNKK